MLSRVITLAPVVSTEESDGCRQAEGAATAA